MKLYGSGLLYVSFIVFLLQPGWAEHRVRIGIVTDLSGLGAFYGQQTRIGAQMAAEDLKAEGILAEMVLEDSSLNTQRGLSAAQKLLFADKVDALYVDFSVIAIALASFIEKQHKLMVYSAAAESVARKHEFAFKTYHSYSQGCAAVAKEFVARGLVPLGVLKAETEYGELCEQGVRSVYPQAIQQTYSPGDTLSSQMLTFRKQGVRAVINGSFEADVRNMLHALRTLRYQVPIGVPEDNLSVAIRAEFSEILSGSLSYGLREPSAELVARARSIDGGKNLGGYEGVSLAYVHLKQLARAIAACVRRDLGCEVSILAQSPADADASFQGWSARMALLRAQVKEYRGHALVPIKEYVSGSAQ